jgi:hypothetical protein
LVKIAFVLKDLINELEKWKVIIYPYSSYSFCRHD